MASYVVMQPASGEDAADRAVFIRDGFAFWAFVIPFFWCLWHRLWLEAVFVFAASLLLAAAAVVIEAGDWPAAVLSLLVNLLVGLEGNNRRIEASRRRGLVEAAIVSANSLADAEERFYGSRGEHSGSESVFPPISPPASMVNVPAGPSGHGLVGLVSHRGGL